MPRGERNDFGAKLESIYFFCFVLILKSSNAVVVVVVVKKPAFRDIEIVI